MYSLIRIGNKLFHLGRLIASVKYMSTFRHKRTFFGTQKNRKGLSQGNN